MDRMNNNTEAWRMVRVAAARARVADEVYTEFCEKYPQEYEQQAVLRAIANDADKNEWQARRDALNTCTCSPDRDAACPVCVAQARRRYGDSIPFGGEV